MLNNNSRNSPTEKYPDDLLVNSLSDSYRVLSEKNLQLLLDSYEDNYKKFASFVGAGVSVPIGIEDWYDLLNYMLSECTDEGRNLELWTNEDARCTYDKFIKKDDFNTDFYPELADHISFDYADQKKIKLFNEIIHEKMEPKNTQSTTALIKMVLSINNHLTTNLDRSINYAYKFLKFINDDINDYDIDNKLENIYNREINIKYYDNAEDPINADCDNIYYLHSSESGDDFTYVLKKSDYDEFYPSIDNPTPLIYQAMRPFYKNYSMIFVGFSFADIYVKKLINRLAVDIAKNGKVIIEKDSRENVSSRKLPKICHYLLIDEKAVNRYTSNRINSLINSLDNNLKRGSISKDEYELRKLDLINNKKDFFFNEFEELNIKPVIYESNKHLFAEKLFENLRKIRNKQL